MLKEKIYQYVEELTKKYQSQNKLDDFTAEEICKAFKVKRNTVSHYLNQLFDEGMLIKINTRPVYFMDKKTFEERFHRVHINKFNNLEELFNSSREENKEDIKKDIFGELIGSSGSLRKIVEQVKTSVLYPPKGLPVLIGGSTGVGKSHIVYLIHRFAIEMGVIKEDAPLVVFNCAQYFNNPELLSTNLFGYVKGTFTGANADMEGMLEKADGGILFLDEVHRLSPEGQEKLFTFMDKGVFRRMGESTGWRRADVRLVFATTEETNNFLLDTFLRRIPIVVNIPNLEQRDINEKLQFIYTFFLGESKILGKNFMISNKVIDCILKYNFRGNIGELMNIIKYLCASAYAGHIKDEEISIRLANLSENIIANYASSEQMHLKNNEEILITPGMSVKDLLVSKNESLNLVKDMFMDMYEHFSEYKGKKLDEIQFESRVYKSINRLFDNLVFKNINEDKSIIMNFITNSLNDILDYFEKSSNVKFNGNSAFALSNYIYSKNVGELELDDNFIKQKNNIYKYVLQNYKEENKLARNMIHLMESKLDIKLSMEDEIFLTFYIKSLNIDSSSERIKGVIATHGYATASSIVNVVNRLLEKNIFEAFDMPIDVSIKEMVEKLNKYIESTDISNGLIIMVDTGSLRDIYSQLYNNMKGSVAVINNVSTQMALDIGNMICNNYSLEIIMEKALKNNQTKYRIVYPQKTNKKKAIFTTCMTGIGTAVKIKKLLEESLTNDVEIEIIACDYNKLKYNGLKDSMFSIYDVLAIIGTDNPKVAGIKYISLEQLISGKGEENLERVFGDIFDSKTIERINMNIIRNFSLERVIHSLTILNTDNIIRQIEEAIVKLEAFMNTKFTNDLKISLYIHISCLIERLIRQCPIKDYKELDNFEKCQRNFIDMVKVAFSVIENMYGVNIINSEIGYIYDIIALKNQDKLN